MLYSNFKRIMRSKIYLLASIAVFATTLTSCKKPKDILYSYNLKITIDDRLSGGTTVKEDTVMARNDSLAYSRAMLKVTAQKQSDKLSKGLVYKFRSFSLTDSIGADVPASLSISYKDSVNTAFSNLAKRLK